MVRLLTPIASRIVCFLLILAGAGPASAQVSLTTLGTPYTQELNALPASGTATFVNNSTILGWYHARTGSGTTVVANGGASNAGNLYSYGTGTGTERALGSIGSGNAAAGNFFWGVRLQNNTGSTITTLDVTYTGEQWRNGGGTGLAQTVAVSYLINTVVTGTLAEFQTAGTGVPGLNFTSPVFSTTAAALDGNVAPNRTTISFSITGLTIPNGSEVMLRWSDPDHASNDHGLAIDDFSVTPQGTGPVVPSLSIDDVSQNEGDSGSTTFAFTVTLSSPAPASGVTFDVTTADNTATTADVDYALTSLISQTIPAGQSSYTFNVDVTGDTSVELLETFFVNVSNITGAAAGDAQGVGTIRNDDVAVSRIHDIQGSGAVSPLVGQVVTIEGIVVGDFETGAKLNGFFVQEEDADADADPATSEGIFVFTNGPDTVNVGDKVQVTGTVAEAFGQTELTSVTNVTVSGAGLTATASTITFPVPNATFLERHEGMAIQIEQPLTVTEVFNHARFGELLLSQGGRLFTPTNVVSPGAAATAQQAANDLRTVLLDDGSNIQNPDPVQYPEGTLSANNTVHVGEIVNNTPGGQNPILGVLAYDFGAYRIQPTGPLTFFGPKDNPRPVAPGAVGGRVRVAGANVLNFFTTLDTGAAICGPSATLGCRGANSTDEFVRQRDKIVNGLLALDPHVLGIGELENNDSVSIQNLVDRLNTVSGVPGKFAFVGGGATIGTDAIRNAIIYQPAVVHPVGNPAILTSAVDPRTLDDRNRPPLAQTFERVGTKSTLQRFTVVVNHFKSKGSSCAGDIVGGVPDVDANDGQGNCNRTRISIALALIDWLATNPTFDPTPAANRKVLIIGDLNSYAREEPIQALTDPLFTKAGLTAVNYNAVYKNLISQYVGPDGYSYVFDGQSGYLDHALANPALETLITGVTEFHVNADEPRAIDYNVEFKSAGQVSSFYDGNIYRFSDHDPVLVGFNPLCGDLDDDGDVDVADQTLIRSRFGLNGQGANRRFDYDRNNTINSNDYRIWLTCQRQYAAP